jgi:hypothetical protein
MQKPEGRIYSADGPGRVRKVYSAIYEFLKDAS